MRAVLAKMPGPRRWVERRVRVANHPRHPTHAKTTGLNNLSEIITLTQHGHDSINARRDRSAKDVIGVTPAMVRAAKDVLYESGLLEYEGGPADGAIVADMLRAAAAAAVGEWPPKKL